MVSCWTPSAGPLPVRSPLPSPPHWSLCARSPYQIFPKCDLQAGGGAGSKQAVSDYVSQVLFQEAGSRRVPTARADASRLRTLRSMPLYWFFLGSGARVLGAAWGSADRRPGGATAPETATQAAAAARARPAPARCLVLGRCRSPAPYCGSMASSATWSACRAKVPGQDALRTAIQGRGRVLRSRRIFLADFTGGFDFPAPSSRRPIGTARHFPFGIEDVIRIFDRSARLGR